MNYKWVKSDDWLPFTSESVSGYFWGWNELAPEHAPFLVQAWDRDGEPMGFCSEAAGIIKVTHWMHVTPPKAPMGTHMSGVGIVDGLAWDWDGRPTCQGWYATTYCWSEEEGMFLSATWWIGDKWESDLPIIGHAGPFEDKAKAESWAKDQDVEAL